MDMSKDLQIILTDMHRNLQIILTDIPENLQIILWISQIFSVFLRFSLNLSVFLWFSMIFSEFLRFSLNFSDFLCFSLIFYDFLWISPIFSPYPVFSSYLCTRKSAACKKGGGVIIFMKVLKNDEALPSEIDSRAFLFVNKNRRSPIISNRLYLTDKLVSLVPIALWSLCCISCQQYPTL